jgi:hypothetical protein
MADQDQPMIDPPAAQTGPTDTQPAEALPTAEKPGDEKTEIAAEVLNSIEVEPNVKEEDAQGDAPADSDAEGEDDDEQMADSSGRPVSNELYKALKAIADALTDFKVKKSGE